MKTFNLLALVKKQVQCKKNFRRIYGKEEIEEKIELNKICHSLQNEQAKR